MVTSPVNEALHRPSPDRRRSRDRLGSGPGWAPGAPAPGGGSASGPTARLDNAFWPLHRRGLGAPGPDEGEPLWRHAPRWTRRTWAIHPAARSRLWRGVASRDHPQGNPPWHSGSRRWTRLSLGGGHGSLLRHTVAPSFPLFRGAGCGTFLTRVREPGPRSRPTREASLGLGLPSALSGDSAVGLSGARRTRWGGGGSGLVPVGSREPREPHRRPVRWGSPDRLTRFGNRVCAGGHVGEDNLDRRLQPSGAPHCRLFLSLTGNLKSRGLANLAR